MSIERLRVVITGGAGFIGSWIAESMVAAGARVTVYDDFSRGFHENLKRIKGDITIVEGDVLDAERLGRALDGADVVSHQAAVIGGTVEDPIHCLQVNIEGSVNVFRCSARAGVQKIIFASSETIYGQARYVPEDEAHPSEPLLPYAVTKLATEHYARIYQRHYGMQMIGLRYSNVYGSREWYGRVSTVFLKRALEGKTPVIWGGDQIRDFLYVSDLVDFHTRCLEMEGVNFQIFNVSTGVGTPIGELARIIAEMHGTGEPLREDVAAGRPSRLVQGMGRALLECKAMVLDNTRARGTGWWPRVDLADGLARQSMWLRENPQAWGLSPESLRRPSIERSGGGT